MGDHYAIFIARGMPDDVLRWYRCKELFHVVLIHGDFQMKDIIEHLNNMMVRSAPESADLDLGHATVCETLAEIAAGEFLIPFSDRVTARKADGNIDFPSLAETYAVPQWEIEYRCSDAYMGVLAPFFGI
jgi:hypothetical protein